MGRDRSKLKVFHLADEYDDLIRSVQKLLNSLRNPKPGA